MNTILDYLDWRGDLPFFEYPFNEVDNLILSEFSYVDFGNSIPCIGQGEICVKMRMKYGLKMIPLPM